jgi:hypothetical protein
MLPGIKTWFLTCSAHSLVSTLTELPQVMHWNGAFIIMSVKVEIILLPSSEISLHLFCSVTCSLRHQKDTYVWSTRYILTNNFLFSPLFLIATYCDKHDIFKGNMLTYF